MDKSLSFSQVIDMTKIVKGTGLISICDIGIVNEKPGKYEVVNQRDWNVPKFKDTANELLCAAFKCNSECDRCVITRLLEEK